MLIFILTLALVELPPKENILFGRFASSTSSEPVQCKKDSKRYLEIRREAITWENGRLDRIVRTYELGDGRYHIWVKNGETGKANLLGVFVDRDHHNAIVIEDEQDAVQHQIDFPGIVDAGIIGIFARCLR